jgi:aryl-alcohol dehydrogenase-like predicted oxidoreductase
LALRISKLILGSVQFGLDYGISNKKGQVEASEVEKIIETAKMGGIEYIDTAIGYGDSESILGSLGVSSFKIISKLPNIDYGKEDVRKRVLAEVKGSCNRLGIHSLSAILLHKPNVLFSPQGREIMLGLNDAVLEGLVEKIGISTYQPEEAIKLSKVWDFSIVQAPVNLLDRRFLDPNVQIKFKNKNISLHGRSTFLQGLLLMKRDERSSFFTKWATTLDILAKWYENNGFTRVESCLIFSLNSKQVNKTLIGVTSAQELQQLIDIEKRLNDPEVNINLQPPDFAKIDPNLINPSKWR